MSDERYERSARLGERENISPLLGFFRRIESLKQLVRTGWVFRKIPEAKAESVADHKWSTMMMADTLTAE